VSFAGLGRQERFGRTSPTFSATGSPGRRAGQLFDAERDGVDGARFAERCEDDRHHFRFIVSPDDARELADLRQFTRDLMDQAARDLGTNSIG
jgi:type IV secretory pathway VirD2 relaxase